MPLDLNDVAAREKDIRFASRTRLNTDVIARQQRLTHAAQSLAAKLPAKGMDVVIDGKAFGARYGHARGDVATYFKTPALAKTGFRVVLPPEMVGPGSHSVTLRIVAADGKAYYETPPVGFTLR